jgi:hypothetical protein
MADYQLTDSADIVRRNADQAYIPNDPANRDWVEYQQWLEDGNEPDPYAEPPVPKPSPAPEDVLLLDHENRLRTLEGQPPLTVEEFIAQKGKVNAEQTQA